MTRLSPKAPLHSSLGLARVVRILRAEGGQLTQLDTKLPTARSALNDLGFAIERTEFLARGATSTSWRLDAAGVSFVFRKIDDDRVLDGKIDSFIRRNLIENGARIAAPVLNSDEVGLCIDGSRWSLDRFVRGVHPERGRMPSEAARQLGETLAVLHDIPVDGFGRPEKLTNGVVVGLKSTPIQGVMQRFENPLPETWEPGFEHPIFGVMPTLRKQIDSHLREVSRQIKLGTCAMCHTDLHERQLICDEDNLIALIDFGEAAILDRYWDLGSALYFHGWQTFKTILDGYLKRSKEDQPRAEMAVSFSIAVAMHHASRSRLQGKGHRLRYATRHVRTAVDAST